ncbi:hypothetical protein [Deinococcus alpinitundrae]|uniref:hypothetical protein n=1 Tax=Deinococcus alpinitundrae TaxID=468913 RepID=UPI001379EC97|nr:hypothetical protein [Deinococcus alpinitundrae]
MSEMTSNDSPLSGNDSQPSAIEVLTMMADLKDEVTKHRWQVWLYSQGQLAPHLIAAGQERRVSLEGALYALTPEYLRELAAALAPTKVQP